MWGRSITITRLGGFDIKVDASWLLIAGLIIWSLSTGYFPEVLPDAGRPLLMILATIAMLGLFVSLVLHELAHSVVARMHGLKIAGITLFLFGGVAELESEPSDPVTELRVAIVGPLASLCLAGLFWSSALIARILGLGPSVAVVLSYLALINLILALFNLAPALPLDGGRVFRALLWRKTGNLLEATRRAVVVSGALAWGLVGLGAIAMFTSGPAAGLWPILLGLFLLAMGRTTYQQAEIRELLGNRTIADVMTHNPVTARPDLSLAEVVNRVFLAEGISFAPVVEEGVLLGYIDLPIVRRIDREHWATTNVEDVVEGLSDEVMVPADLPVQELLTRISQDRRGKFIVVDGHDLLGVVTLRDITAYLDVSRQLV